MYYTKNHIFAIMAVAAFFFLWGCSLLNSDKMVIDKQFLYNIERAFQEEAKLGCDKSEIYNTLWERNYFELIYLTEKGDRKAIDISISLIGQKNSPTCLFEEIGLLIKPTFESDVDYFWKTLEKKTTDVQVTVLYMFDLYKPIDWDLESYLAKHQEIKNLFESKYGKEN